MKMLLLKNFILPPVCGKNILWFYNDSVSLYACCADRTKQSGGKNKSIHAGDVYGLCMVTVTVRNRYVVS